MKRMATGVFLALALCLPGVLRAESRPDASRGSLALTEQDVTQLRLAQKDAIIAAQAAQLARMQAEKLRDEAKAAYVQFMDKVSALKRQHGWGDEVTFDPQSFVFTVQPKSGAEGAK